MFLRRRDLVLWETVALQTITSPVGGFCLSLGCSQEECQLLDY